MRALFGNKKIKNMQIKLTFISTAFIALLMSCANSKQATSAETGKETVVVADSLYGPKWYLAKIYESTGVREVTARKSFIRFNREQGSAGGNGSCNTFGSTLKADGYTISITNIFSTKMWCEGVQPTEDSFFKKLGVATRFEIRGNMLSLYQNDNLVLEFVKGEYGS
jgi:heat shock protein HslJ